jgi:hypothetical protein
MLSYGNARAELPVPAPFTATFVAEYRGIGAGSLIFAFAQDATSGQYSYETHADPSMLARLIISPNAIERSEMTIDEAGVRPLHWRVDDGKSGKEEDGELKFDWAAPRVRGEIKGEPVDLPAQPGLQDRISVQIALMTTLLRGVEPGTIPMVDDDHIKYYQYKKGNSQVLDTRIGKLDTVIYESTREGSNRVSRFWLAPALGFTPVRAEQIRKGRVETVLTISALKRPAT